jgi:hypothetical protein
VNTIFKSYLVLLLAFAAIDTPARSTPGRISITIIDSATQKPTPVRVKLLGKGKVVNALPAQAIGVMYGYWDHADGYAFQPDSSFYCNGYFELDLPPGEYTLSLSKGIEYLQVQEKIRVTPGTTFSKTFSLSRWIDMASQNWYSADDHIHLRRSPREDSLIMNWIKAEDVNVGVLLKMGDFWATYYDQYAWGDKGVFTNGKYMLTAGQEDPRTPEVGHALGFGASAPVRYANEYYYYDKVFDKLHELGGLSGYAHQAESFHGYRGLMIDGLRRKVDMLELVQFCVSQDPLQTRHYYHLLDLGYAVTAVAGSDFPWCGNDHDGNTPGRNARIGNARFYTYLNEPLSLSAWKHAVKQGHTFVTTGPMLRFTVNGKLPGDTLYLRKGDAIKIEAHAYGHDQQVPLGRLELVLHGEIIATATTQQGSAATLKINKELTATTGFWVAARAYAAPGQAAHTTPVYVSVDHGGFHNSSTVQHYLDLAEQYLRELEAGLRRKNDSPELRAWQYRKGLEKRIAATREVIEQLRKRR